ncbi:MAG: hypothetical protein KME52_24935 [Desmonostoc geniculatum HA4340-LM1]|jgi:hypothetical protein|nr:hypothetical protein [Desmonostoc geniculatum HA4340-LM1]
MTETPYQKTNIVDVNGNVINSFGGGSGSGGDASATNQTTQITRETEIRDRLGDTAVTGATMPSGGTGLFGWLSAIYLFLTQRIPTLVGGRIPVDVASLSVTVNNAQLEIANDVGNPIPVNGTVALSNSSIEIANDVGNPIPVTSIATAIAAIFASLTLTNANTEYSFAFTSVKKYSFKVLSGGSLRFTNATGKVAGSTLPYYTLDSTSEEVQDFGTSTFTGTLYFASPTAGTVVLIQYWA